ncbi:MAG TPA: MBOAT family protein, partial [Aequorivita sp.]|nr:MBOAT family protein [Aequorivita sp.]
RRTVPAQKNLLDLGLYISLFPQLIAGPIVRYEDIYKEIRSRTVTREGFSSGILKFIRGLAKKVIIANNVGLIADKAFDIPVGELGMFTSWVAIICYALQIYFDFSGYSDMAIGLGRMFG